MKSKQPRGLNWKYDQETKTWKLWLSVWATVFEVRNGREVWGQMKNGNDPVVKLQTSANVALAKKAAERLFKSLCAK